MHGTRQSFSTVSLVCATDDVSSLSFAHILITSFEASLSASPTTLEVIRELWAENGIRLRELCTDLGVSSFYEADASFGTERFDWVQGCGSSRWYVTGSKDGSQNDHA
jgi:hypothetical protein